MFCFKRDLRMDAFFVWTFFNNYNSKFSFSDKYKKLILRLWLKSYFPSNKINSYPTLRKMFHYRPNHQSSLGIFFISLLDQQPSKSIRYFFILLFDQQLPRNVGNIRTFFFLRFASSLLKYEKKNKSFYAWR